MGFDCGFDIYPRLEATAANKEAYRQFLDEIIRTYGDAHDEEGRRANGKVLDMPTDPDYSDEFHSDKAYIWFMVGEWPHMPSSPDRCDYFLRFSSKVSGRLTAPAEPYIRSVCKIARKYFGSRVHFWHELNETGDERQRGYYNWLEVHDASKKLRALETGQEPDLASRASSEERSETKSTSPGAATTAGLGNPPSAAANASQASNLAQDGGSSPSALPDQLSPSSPPPGIHEEGNLLYAIRPIPGKGQGLIATSRIRKGTRILSEAPLFKVPRDEPDLQVVDGIIVRALKGLDRDQQRAFFALHNAYGRRHSPFLGIARTNVLPLGASAREGGLFLAASRANHACRHNAQNTWNAGLGRLTLHALRDIEPGQEITIAYLGRRMERAARRRFLKETFYFDCGCDLCALPPAPRAASDRRLRRIQSIDDALGHLGASIADDDGGAGLRLVRELLGLLGEEGIWDASVPRAYYDAFQIAIAGGDEARAKVFAERAHAARVVVEGADSPEAARLRQLADRPAQHRLYELSAGGAPREEASPPPDETDGPELEDWLWRENAWSTPPAAPSAQDDPWGDLGEALRYSGESFSDEMSDSFDSRSTGSIRAALFRSLNKP